MEKSFNQQQDFLAHLKDVHENTEWRLLDPASLEFVSDEANKETGFTISDGLFTEEARACSLRSLYERYGVNAPILDRIPASERATVLNYAAQYAGHKPMQCPIVFGKINAFLSTTYVPYPEYKLFEKLAHLGNAEGFRACWDFDHCSAMYRFDNLRKIGEQEFPVYLRVRTSDIGESSVSFRAEIGKDTYTIPVMSDVYIVHKGANVESAIDQMVKSIDSVIDEKCRKLGNLMLVGVTNPTAAAKRAAKYARLPKKIVLEILQNKEFDVTATNAFDIYMTLSKVIEKAGGENDRIRYGGDLAKLISANWSEFDLPGDFAW